MTKSVEERLRELVVMHLHVHTDKVTPEASFVGNLGADSLDIVEIAMAVEFEFDIEVNDEDFDKADTFSALVALVEKLTSDQQPSKG